MTEEKGSNHEKEEKKRDGSSVVFSIIALIVSIFSAGFTWYWNSPIGDVFPLEPSGYAIVRGIDPTFEGESDPGEGLGVGPYPSDHLVIPTEWSNSSGSSILVKNPVLLLHKLGEDGERTGDVRRFFMVGEFPEMSVEVFNDVNSKPHTFQNSLALEPHTVSQSISVFRIEGWDKEPNDCFRFYPGERYQVEIEFNRIPEDPKQSAWWRLTGEGSEKKRMNPLVKSLTIQTNADFISPYGKGKSIGWDFFSLLPGSRSTQSDTPPRGAPEYRYSEEPPCDERQGSDHSGQGTEAVD